MPSPTPTYELVAAFRPSIQGEESQMKPLKRSDCAILHLGLKRPWYRRIDRGEKRIEFREATPYWQTRIANWMRKIHDGKTPVLEFQNGYSRYSPRMTFIAGDGSRLLFEKLAATDPVQHPDLGEFPKARYCLFIGKRVKLED